MLHKKYSHVKIPNIKTDRYIIGVDEVGRGPLAGPVSVCIVGCTEKNYKILRINKNLPKVGLDSKKLSAIEREKYSDILKKFKREDKIFYGITHVTNKTIDSKGIAFSIKKAILTLIKKTNLNPIHSKILLDGGLKFPNEFKNQKTIIKGDEREKIIAWSSILAKVSRDSLMVRQAKLFPQYGFESHKGYGTRTHQKAIRKYGLTPIHRTTFINH